MNENIAVGNLPSGRLITTNQGDQPDYTPMQWNIVYAVNHFEKCWQAPAPYYSSEEEYPFIWGMGFGFF